MIYFLLPLEHNQVGCEDVVNIIFLIVMIKLQEKQGGTIVLAHGLSGAAHHAEEGKEVWLLCLLLSKLLGQAQFPGPMGLEAACSP